MSFKAASIIGSIVVLIALAITFMKALIAFLGFITTAFQILIVLAFVVVFAGIGYLVFRAWRDRSTTPD
jgi:membrane protein implicated in regulation of membrane protease activity